MMTSKDTYDIALKTADKAMRQLQFFVAICIAFGGWVFAGETIAGLDRVVDPPHQTRPDATAGVTLAQLARFPEITT